MGFKVIEVWALNPKPFAALLLLFHSVLVGFRGSATGLFFFGGGRGDAACLPETGLFPKGPRYCFGGYFPKS